MSTTPLASGLVGNQTLTLQLFELIVLVTLGLTFWASHRNKSLVHYYAGGRQITSLQNGLAMSGDYMSAASFLGISGAIALGGYDGFLYSIGFLVAWLVALLLVAEPIRNSGRYTMADVLAYRMRQRPVRMAASASTVVVSVFYLVAQMSGAGKIVTLLTGFHGALATSLTLVIVGLLMIVYVTVGGMLGTTWVQIVKAVLLLLGTFLVTGLVLARFGFNFSELLDAAAQRSGHGSSFLEPGLMYGGSMVGNIDFISLALALVLGTAGLPHILTRFYTVPSGPAARRSVVWAIALIGAFYLMTLVLGFGAAALVGSERIRKADEGGNLASPLLAQAVGGGPGSAGGAFLLAFIAAVAFATILAVVAGLTLTAAMSFGHDLYAEIMQGGRASEETEIRVARFAAFGIGGVAIALSFAARHQNIAFLVGLAFAVAASGNLPCLLYTLYWKRFNTAGALWSIYGGLSTSMLLVIFSPVVSGSPTAMLPGVDFSWFPLSNPGIVSIPAGFILGWAATELSQHGRGDRRKHAALEVRALTGAGAAGRHRV